MNRYKLLHVTEFAYDGPVSESFNEVRLRPIHDDRQSCLSFRLSTSPAAPVSGRRDYYGNWVNSFNILREHRRLRIEAESVVLMHESPPEMPDGVTMASLDEALEEIAEEHYEYLASSAYVPHSPEVRALASAAEEQAGGLVSGFARSASDLVHTRFRYEKGATHVHSSILDVLSSGSGVCQDFAHLLLAVLRVRGIPARYVSGYLVPRSSAQALTGANQEDVERGANFEEVVGGQASHAWVEAHVPTSGWMPLDPTLGRPVAMQHIRVAYGRDYADVAPVRGVYKGHAGQQLFVDVGVRPALNNEGHERLQESTAIPQAPPPADEPAQQQQQ